MVEIGEAVPAGTIKGKLLSKKTEEIYTRTSTPVTAQFDVQTKIVMGKPSDLRAGAIVHVTGTIRGDLGLEVGRNLIHASDSAESAAREIGLWFGASEVVAWARDTDRWISE